MKLSLDVVKKDAKENNLNVIQSGISWNEEKGRKSKMFVCQKMSEAHWDMKVFQVT